MGTFIDRFASNISGLYARGATMVASLGNTTEPLPKRLLDGLGLESSTRGTEENGPYLTRYYVTPRREWWRRARVFGRRLPSVYLHWFHRGDADPEFHNHPFEWSWSLIVWGGYREELVDGFAVHRDNHLRMLAPARWRDFWFRYHATGSGYRPALHVRELRPGWVNRLYADTFHRVELLDPRGCLTLFVVGPRVDLPRGEDWGFLSRDGTNYTTIGEWEHTQSLARGWINLAQKGTVGTT